MSAERGGLLAGRRRVAQHRLGVAGRLRVVCDPRGLGLAVRRCDQRGQRAAVKRQRAGPAAAPPSTATRAIS